MPHAGHLIVGNDCRFHLATRVGKYLISTVGEYDPDQGVKRIHAEVHDKPWYQENAILKGDSFNYAYQQKFGFTEIGYNRTYETMVFKVRKADRKDAEEKYDCCSWTAASWSDIDGGAYTTATDAYKGHLALCNKYAKK